MRSVLTAAGRHHRPIISGTAVLALVAGVVLISQVRTSHPPAAAPLPTATFSLGYQPAPVDSGAATIRLVAPAESLAARHVYVPSLGIDASWSSEPITAGSLVIPHDVHTIGLSAAGGQPDSETGTVLLASHVNYRGQGLGVFASLYRILPGALVVLTDDAGHASRWRITELTDPMKADLDPGLFTAQGQRRLALVTCGGQVHNGEYDRNIVAVAAPDEDATESPYLPKEKRR